MKEALLKSELRYKSLFDYNSDVVCEVNLQGNILAINSAAEQITGEALNMVGENLSIMNLFGVENILRMSDFLKEQYGDLLSTMLLPLRVRMEQ